MPTSPTAMASATRTIPPVLTGRIYVSRSFRSHPLDGCRTLRAHADEAEVLEDVAEFVFVEEVGSAVGQQPHSGAARPAVGTITAIRPPGRSTLAISARVAAGFGISCSTAMETAASTVSSRSGSCCASARRKPTCGPAWALTARASIGSEMSTPEASPSRPAARANEAVTLPGPLPDVERDAARRDVQPLGRQLTRLITLRAIACALS